MCLSEKLNNPSQLSLWMYSFNTLQSFIINYIPNCNHDGQWKWYVELCEELTIAINIKHKIH